MNRPLRAVAAVSLVSLVSLVACGGGDASDVPLPIVDEIDAAIEAVEAHYGAPQEYFEISATLDRVSVIVAVDGATAAEQGFYVPGDGLDGPEPVGEASGATFGADAIDLDTAGVFDQLRDELDDPAIIDFAIQGNGSGGVVYDATVASDAGGRLLVLLSRNGRVLGVQAE